MVTYLIVLAAVIAADIAGRWAFLPAKYLPRNRARALQVRLHLRLHPGKGFATIFALHLRWGRLAARPAPPVASSISSGITVPGPSGKPASPGARGERKGRRAAGSGRAGTKTARFLALVTDQHGPLAAVPLGQVARISAARAPRAGLHSGSARAALRRAVLAAQNGQRS